MDISKLAFAVYVAACSGVLRSRLFLIVAGAGIVAHQQAQVKNGLVRTVSGRAPAPAAIDDKSQMKARGGKQQVVRQHPKPFADIQGRKKCGESGGQVEVGQRIVK